MAVQSLTRAFDIVELLAHSRDGMGLSAIAKELNLPTSTVYRLLSAMRERGYVEQTKKSGEYRIGLAFVDMSSLYLGRLELRTEAEPVLRDLSMETGQTAFLAIRDGSQIVYIDKMEEYNSLRKYSIIGQRKPVYATALGKALLIGLDDPAISELLVGLAFDHPGPRTHRDQNSLLADIAACRERGWALDDEEAEPGVRCVAAPIRDYRGRVIAAVSVSWLISAFPAMDISQTAVVVTGAASGISRRMGGRESLGK